MRAMRERANGSNIVLRCFILWHETEIFCFGHEIFCCYGYLFFHIQRTWWRNFYFMLFYFILFCPITYDKAEKPRNTAVATYFAN